MSRQNRTAADNDHDNDDSSLSLYLLPDSATGTLEARELTCSLQAILQHANHFAFEKQSALRVK